MACHSLSRRQFLRRAGVLTACGLTVPTFLQRSRSALAASPIAGLPDDRVLVLIQLAGGNDGLNTLVPYADDLYHRARPTLAVSPQDVLKLDDYAGLHGEMYALKSLYDDGRLAMVQNVGYPNPDLSHFRSTEIWETGSAADQNLTTGWIGRYFDNECRGAATSMLGLQLGERTAQTFSAERPRSIAFANPQLFDFAGGATGLENLARSHHTTTPANETLDFLMRTGNDVLAVSRQLRDAVKDRPTAVGYLPYQFSQSLKFVAQLIAAETPTRVYYVSLPGFDHHATQKMRHAVLLQEFSEALSSFVRDLAAQGHLDRTLIMTFSEFGRRVAENKSAGTDHGTANVMFLAGGGVRPGLHGPRADLAKLDPVGDLVHAIDFRSLYATVLRSWLKADPAAVLGPQVTPHEGLWS
jgi:uncharacterized protein (DUF1501 family)